MVDFWLTLITRGRQLFTCVHLQAREWRAEHLLVLCDQHLLQFSQVIDKSTWNNLTFDIKSKIYVYKTK